ncbi:MAG: hypothetical protein ABEJ93_03605 [Candidatus Nanohalobium sp.]
MSSVEEVLDGSDDELKSEDLSSGEEWRRLPERPSSGRDYPTYHISGIDGSGTLRLEEAPEGLEWDLIMVYEFGFAGDEEPVSSLQDEDPDVHTIDLPYNLFDDEQEAEAYMDFVMDYSIENVLDEYGMRPAKSRRV